MSFDSRSKQRLEALGRTLPKKLSLPDAAKGLPGPGPESAVPRGKQGEAGRHSLEKEQDPAELFRVLMQTSPDGTVPPHLLERLRELETSTRMPPPQERGSRTAGHQGPRAQPQGRASSPSGRASAGGKEEQDLYSAFAQRLLEDDDA
jgi:hypothetical protein